MNYPTAKEVDERIAYLQANPDKRAPSNDYCRSCLLAAMSHCSDPINCGGRTPFEGNEG